jgi:hypothetical protein
LIEGRMLSIYHEQGENVHLEPGSTNLDSRTISEASRKVKFLLGKAKRELFCFTEFSAVTRYSTYLSTSTPKALGSPFRHSRIMLPSSVRIFLLQIGPRYIRHHGCQELYMEPQENSALPP